MQVKTFFKSHSGKPGMVVTPSIPALKRLKQENCPEFGAGQGYRMRPCLKKKKKEAAAAGVRAKWQNTGLACAKPQVQFPAL